MPENTQSCNQFYTFVLSVVNKTMFRIPDFPEWCIVYNMFLHKTLNIVPQYDTLPDNLIIV